MREVKASGGAPMHLVCGIAWNVKRTGWGMHETHAHVARRRPPHIPPLNSTPTCGIARNLMHWASPPPLNTPTPAASPGT